MITGIFPPIPTPFVNDEIAFDKLRDNLNSLIKSGVNGVVALGSNGEAVYLSRPEKLALLEQCRAILPEDKPLIAGTGLESIKETIALTNAAARLGVTAALVITPSFYAGKMDHTALIRYYKSVADAVDIPVLIYNVPKFTGINIAPVTVAALAGHPNIIGVKNSSENMAHLGEIIQRTPPDFSVLVGTASVLFSGISLGASGGIVALANIAARECLQIFEWTKAGEWDNARELQLRMISVNKAITADYGIAGLKAAMDMLGRFGGHPRKPLGALSPSDRKALAKILKEAGLPV